jgi:hypothetical protein
VTSVSSWGDSGGIAGVRFLFQRIDAAIVVQCSVSDLAPNEANDLGGVVEVEPLVSVLGSVEIRIRKTLDRIKQAAAHRQAVESQDSRQGDVAGLGVCANLSAMRLGSRWHPRYPHSDHA